MTKTEKVAQLFRRRRRTWVSALTVMQSCDCPLAWRTEIDRCRKQLKMRIFWNRSVTRSAYRYEGKAA